MIWSCVEVAEFLDFRTEANPLWIYSMRPSSVARGAICGGRYLATPRD